MTSSDCEVQQACQRAMMSVFCVLFGVAYGSRWSAPGILVLPGFLVVAGLALEGFIRCRTDGPESAAALVARKGTVAVACLALFGVARLSSALIGPLVGAIVGGFAGVITWMIAHPPER